MRSHLEHALAMNQLLHFPEELERIIGPSAQSYDYGHDENKGMEPVAADIKETAKGYVFYADVPGLTKSDIQVFVEEEKMLVIKCQGGKRKRKEVEEEENCIIQLHALLGNRWSAIASQFPKRTDNEIKNYWNTHLKKRLLQMGIDPVTH